MDDNKINLEIEKIANLMVHDDVSSDEQDVTKLEKYRDQIKIDLNVSDEESMKLVYETLVYRKLKSSDSSKFSEFSSKATSLSLLIKLFFCVSEKKIVTVTTSNIAAATDPAVAHTGLSNNLNTLNSEDLDESIASSNLELKSFWFVYFQSFLKLKFIILGFLPTGLLKQLLSLIIITS